MDKIRRYSSVAFTVLFAFAVFFFFFFQCRCQFSECIASHYTTICSVPGGFAGWCGGLLVRLFARAPIGAAMCALLLTMAQLLCYLTFRNRNLLLYSLSFIPTILLWISWCGGASMLGAVVALIIALAALYAVFRFDLAPVFRLLLIPVLYFLCGPVASVYALAICADRIRPALLAGSILIFAVCLLAGPALFHCASLQPGTGCCSGSTFAVTWMPLIASGLAAVLCWLSSLDWSGVRPSTSTWLGWCLAMVMAAAIPSCIGNHCSPCKEKGMQQGTSADWERGTPGEFPSSAGPIYPDYMGVTVPAGIAPLNFSYTAPGTADAVTTFSCAGESFSVKGKDVRIPMRRWRSLLRTARGSEITVTSSALDTTWTISVSEDDIDYGLTYRLLEPGYEVYSKMGIYERELGSYKETAVIENTEFSGCVNCHATNRGEPSQFSLHIRGDHGATLLRLQGNLDAYNTKTDSTLGFCVYPYWHPEGEYIAYSTNSTRQGFHVQPDKIVEVFDLDSDLQVYDITGNCIITAPQVKRKDYWETFPSFSPDGRTLYFCRAVPKDIPEAIADIRYSFCKVGFDPATGTIGDDVEVLIDAEADSVSVCFPRPSYDGRYIIYTQAAYGNFSIWHHEADLWMLDLQTGGRKPLDILNSPDTESYHNFSSNGKWFQFASRRDDGLFTRIYISHFDPETGEFTKPFMLPQKNPRTFYRDRFLSYNVTEFTTGPVRLDKVCARKKIASPERIPFGFRWSE